LREPLNPHAPALDQEMTFPDTSVIVTMVLLKVELMCATPVWTFFLTLRFACRFGCAIP
jgi:Na+-translocating ferredoxin:NAD+ oxidoreductase RnfD subunit